MSRIFGYVPNMYAYAANRCNIAMAAGLVLDVPVPPNRLFFSKSAHAIHTNAPYFKKSKVLGAKTFGQNISE